MSHTQKDHYSDLREIRAQLQWTQERMAKELAVSLRSYCRHESAGGNQTLRKLAAFVALASSPDAAPNNPN